jgi:hypothetical protein
VGKGMEEEVIDNADSGVKQAKGYDQNTLLEGG